MSTPAENKKHIIELIDVSKNFDGVSVVENLNFYIRKGEFITFLGPSGCGKTTTLRMIAGFEMPSSGKILLNGKDISELPPNRRPVNTVFQKYALFPHLNVFENVAFGLKLKKLPKDVIAEKVKNALEIVDLAGFEKRSISTLSGGQQQRIAIARSISSSSYILSSISFPSKQRRAASYMYFARKPVFSANKPSSPRRTSASASGKVHREERPER